MNVYVNKYDHNIKKKQYTVFFCHYEKKVEVPLRGESDINTYNIGWYLLYWQNYCVFFLI